MQDFRKGHLPKFTKEIFKISDVLNTNLENFKIRALDGEEIMAVGHNVVRQNFDRPYADQTICRTDKMSADKMPTRQFVNIQNVDLFWGALPPTAGISQLRICCPLSFVPILMKDAQCAESNEK